MTSKIKVDTIENLAGSGNVSLGSGHNLVVPGNNTVGGTQTVSGASTFEQSISVGTTTNLLSNGDFTTNTTGWAATGSTIAISSGALQLTPNSGVNGFANQQVDNLVVGRSYIASVIVTQDAGSYSRLYIGTSANGNQTVNSVNLGTGAHSFTFVATATTHHFALVVGGGTGQVTKFDAARLTEASRIIFPAVTGIAPEIKQGTTVNDFAIATNQVNRLNIDVNGHVTMPSQPAFFAKLSSAQSNIAINTDVTVLFNSEIFDQNADFNTSNYTFTAPVTGRYLLTCHVMVEAADTATSYYQLKMKTSNRIHYCTDDFGGLSADPDYKSLDAICICDMDANDTAFVQIYQAGGTSQSDLNATTCTFSGCLLA